MKRGGYKEVVSREQTGDIEFVVQFRPADGEPLITYEISILRIFSEKASGWGNLRQDDSGTDLGLTVGRLIIACSIIAVNFPGKFDFLFSSLDK